MNDKTNKPIVPTPQEAVDTWLDSSPLHTLFRDQPEVLKLLPEAPAITYREMLKAQGETVLAAAKLAFLEGYMAMFNNVKAAATAKALEAGVVVNPDAIPEATQ